MSSINKDILLGKCQVISEMTDREGVKQLADILIALINDIYKDEIGFVQRKDDK